MYEYRTVVRFSQTDAAGKLFFAGVFTLAHNCYESFISDRGIKISKILDEKKILLPVVHAEADYRKPLFADDEIRIMMTAAKISDSSFRLEYAVKKNNGELAAEVSIVHVLLDYSTRKKIKLPENIREALLGLGI